MGRSAESRTRAPVFAERASAEPPRRRSLVAVARVSLVGLVLAGAAACARPVEGLYPPAPGEPTISIYLVTHSWHTGIAFRLADVAPGLWELPVNFPATESVEVGWGDRDYWTASRPTVWLGLKAGLYPTPSALRFIGYSGPVERFFVDGDIAAVQVSRRGFNRLVEFVAASFARPQGLLIDLGPGPLPASRFYLGRGGYHMFNTSNTWTARALRAAGLPVWPWLSFTSSNLLYQTDGLGVVIQQQAEPPDPVMTGSRRGMTNRLRREPAAQTGSHVPWVAVKDPARSPLGVASRLGPEDGLIASHPQAMSDPQGAAMDNWISFPRVEGVAARQAHVGVPSGTYEREMSKEGFYGPATQLYHRHPPTSWVSFQGPLRPRCFDLNKLEAGAPSPWEAPELLSNLHVRVQYWRLTGPMDHLVRNGDGDQLIFVHEGAGHLFCDFGHLSIREGDFVVLPRGTMWRVEPDQPVTALLVEARSDSIRLPAKGMIGQHAPFDPAVLEVPRLDAAFRAQQGEKRWRIVVKRREQLSTVTFPYNPLDVVGWSGTLLPVRINWRDVRPVMSPRLHLPPSAHTTFVSSRFVLCTFVPRPIESDPQAQRVPFFHSNDDFDEIIFYHAGEFFSRDHIRPGMLTVHPSGFTHGPHPRAFAVGAAGALKETDEVAVMIDTRDAVDVSDRLAGTEWSGYVDSWKPGETTTPGSDPPS